MSIERIILKPELEQRKKWGILAHVSEIERKRIMGVPHGQFRREIKMLERDIKEAEKKKKKKTVEYSSYMPKSSMVMEWHQKIMKQRTGEKDE